MQKNLYFFAAGKSIAQLKEMNALLVDESGKIRNWNDFKKEVLKLNKQYNLRYLQAEYQTAKASAQSARKWNKAQKVKHLYPNLEYRTVLDDRVREEHAKLHGVIRPIDDSFWDTRYPPNGWRCRCTTRSSDKEPTPKGKIPNVPVHKHFRHNVGKTGQIFNEKQHPYYKYIHNCQDDDINAAMSKCKKLILKQMETAKLAFPLYKVRYKSKTGAKVYVSKFADKKDLKPNYKRAIKIANAGKDVYIRPDVDTNILIGYTNPEYLINNLISDLASPKSKRGIISAIYKKSKYQKVSSLVIDLTYDYKGTIREAAMGIRGAVKQNKKIKEIIVIKGNKVVFMERKYILGNKYWLDL